jgi:transcriptional regulator with XRE-family HTH domain
VELYAIGKIVREERLKEHLTQARLAELAGVSRATLNSLEKGTKNELGFAKLDKILGIVGYDLAPVRSPRNASRVGGILRRMAGRYIWWQPPVESVKTPLRVIAQVMDVGTLEDIQELAGVLGKRAFIDVLRQARPGWFRPRSWALWHTVLGFDPPVEIPPMPTRRRDGLPDPA